MNQTIPLPRYAAVCALLWLLGLIFFFSNAGHVELHLSLEADAADTAQTYYSFNGQWNEADSIKSTVAKGVNDLVVPLPGLFVGSSVRFDPGQNPGNFRIADAYWTVGTARIPIAYRSIIDANPSASEAAPSDTDLRLIARDNDPQLIVPKPPLSARIGNLMLPIGFAIAALLVFVVAHRRVPLPAIAAGVVGSCCLLYLYIYAVFGPHLPLFDDWRYVLPGDFSLVRGWAWLGVVGNDTYFLTNQLIDFSVLRLSNVDFYALRLAAVSVLMLQIVLQIRLLLRTTRGHPLIGAGAIAAVSASLAAGAYWSGEAAIGYQQALPTLFGTMLLGFFVQPVDARLRASVIVAMVACCVASGLAYISGGVLLMALGIAAAIAYRHDSPALTRRGMLVLGCGVVLFAIQFALVTMRQGSLLAHAHRVPTVLFNDHRFWIFFASLFGRALGYKGVSFAVDALCAVVMLAPALIIFVRELRGSSADAGVPRFWSLVALYAGLGAGTYAAIVAFGRAGFATETATASQISALGKLRFHFWPVAAMVPYVWLGWAVCVQRWPRRAARLAMATAAVAVLVPKSLSTFDNASMQREISIKEHEGARCVVAHLPDMEAGRPVLCTTLTSMVVDIGPTLRMLRDRHARVYERLLEEGSPADNAVRP